MRHLVKPFQNHEMDNTATTQTTDNNKRDNVQVVNTNMYAARVEMRLAQERQAVLKEFVRLEKEEQQLEETAKDEQAGEKRKRQE